MLRILHPVEAISVVINLEKVTLPDKLDVPFGSVKVNQNDADIRQKLALTLYHTNDIHLGHGQSPVIRSDKDYSMADYQRVRESLEQGQYQIFYNHRGKQHVIFTGNFSDLNQLDRRQRSTGNKFRDTLDALADDFPDFVKEHRQYQ